MVCFTRDTYFNLPVETFKFFTQGFCSKHFFWGFVKSVELSYFICKIMLLLYQQKQQATIICGKLILAQVEKIPIERKKRRRLVNKLKREKDSLTETF